MQITRLSRDLIPQVIELMKLGAPYIRPRTYSDYWLYTELFPSTCPVALDGNTIAGVVIAFRSQEEPNDIYVQDVMTHPHHRQKGVASRLLETVRSRATHWGCTRIYLTSEPDNTAAHATWCRLGFKNIQGDTTVNGISIITNFKGPDRSRAVYELHLLRQLPCTGTDIHRTDQVPPSPMTKPTKRFDERH